jgi:[ribosomal protein S5]-alanine N-acetyltransferase
MSPPVPETLRTARLLLRPWNAADAVALRPVLEANAAHLGPWIPSHVATPAPLPELAERLAGFASDFTDDRAYRYALLTPDGAHLLGEADLFPRDASGRVPLAAADRVELGYWLASNATGKGLATEATRALLEMAATLPRMIHAEIRCNIANAPSAGVPQRLGFQLISRDADTQVWQKPFSWGAPAAPTLRGRRVVLRAPQPSDVADRLAAGRDPEFRRMVGAVGADPGPLTQADAERWYEKLEREPLGWVIVYEAHCVGIARLHGVDQANRTARLSLGLFAPTHRGRGLGTEAMQLMLTHAFVGLALATVRLRVLSFNARALACYRHCGFREVGREAVELDGERAEDIIMELTAPEFRASQAESAGPGLA